MLQALNKFKDNDLDFYKTIYSGIKPIKLYKSSNRAIDKKKLSKALNKKLNDI
jgi:hypothetical protein